MDSCHHQKDNLILYVYGELDAGAAKEVENHLQICESCRQERLRLLSLLGKLQETAVPPELSPGEVKSMVTNIKWRLRNDQAEKSWRRYLIFRPSLMIPAIAAVFLLVIFAGIVGYQKLHQKDGLPPFAQNQGEESMLSDKDLEIIENLDLLKQMDALQKLYQVVDIDLENQPQGEVDNDTRGMRQDAYREYYV